MAEAKKSFPMLPIGHWWELRKKFKQSIPGIVTDSYLATVLDMQANSARANVLPFLKQLKITDEEGKTGERAKQWRDDDRYPDVCKAMLQEVYPRELLEAVPNPSSDRARAERWFANQTGAGDAAVRRMAALYEVLTEADASKQPDQEKKDRPRKSTQRVASERKDVPAPARPVTHQENGKDAGHTRPHPPGININLEIHISADATPDQIDQIFASMAKHIYSRG